MYYLCDINNDYYDCETCLWDGICDQLTFEIPGTTYFPSENGVRKSRVYVPKEGCRYYTPLLVDGSGAVYVPHIDDRKILTFTVEDKPAGVPDPVDLNPFDEWSDIDDSHIRSDYIWEEM